jgi:predicted AlkP superfamily pyrophosphatase or phosphodiesterase
MFRLTSALVLLFSIVAQAAAADSDRHVIVITLDGFPAYYLDDPEVDLPVIRGLRDAGASTEKGMHVTNPSVTWPNHTTLMTGVHPEKHGVLFNGVPKRNSPSMPTTVTPDRTQSQLVRIPLLFDILKKKGMTTAAINWPCTSGSENIDDNMPDAPHMFIHTSPRLMEETKKAGLVEKFETGGAAGHDEVWTETTCRLIRDRMPRFLALHLLELDSTHHQHGPNSPQGRAVAALLDGRVGRVVKAVEDAGLRDKTAIFVTADHGFIAVTKALRPNAILRKKGLITEEDGKITSARVHVVPEGGIGMVYLVDPATADENRKTVHRLFDGAEGVASVIDATDFPRLHLPRPEDHPGMADMIIAAKEGYSVAGSTKGDDFVVAHKDDKRTGSHGYLSTEPKMNALFVAWGAGIRRGAKLPSIENVDVAPTAAHLLGVELKDVTGRVLTEFLDEGR